MKFFGVPKTFLGSHWKTSQNNVHNIIKDTIFLFHSIDIFSDAVKAVVGKTVGTLDLINSATLYCTS